LGSMVLLVSGGGRMGLGPVWIGLGSARLQLSDVRNIERIATILGIAVSPLPLPFLRVCVRGRQASLSLTVRALPLPASGLRHLSPALPRSARPSAPRPPPASCGHSLPPVSAKPSTEAYSSCGRSTA
jgi:hypothetical protein